MSGVAIDQEWAKAASLEPRSPKRGLWLPSGAIFPTAPWPGYPRNCWPQEIPRMSVSPSRSPSTALPQLLVTSSEASMKADDDYDDDLDSPQ